VRANVKSPLKWTRRAISLGIIPNPVYRNSLSFERIRIVRWGQCLVFASIREGTSLSAMPLHELLLPNECRFCKSDLVRCRYQNRLEQISVREGGLRNISNDFNRCDVLTLTRTAIVPRRGANVANILIPNRRLIYSHLAPIHKH
jgi:hypothetical protein